MQWRGGCAGTWRIWFSKVLASCRFSAVRLPVNWMSMGAERPKFSVWATMSAGWKQNSYWLGSMQTVHMYGWDPAGIARRDQRTERLTQENIKEMFNKYFPMNRYTLVTLKPE